MFDDIFTIEEIEEAWGRSAKAGRVTLHALKSNLQAIYEEEKEKHDEEASNLRDISML